MFSFPEVEIGAITRTEQPFENHSLCSFIPGDLFGREQGPSTIFVPTSGFDSTRPSSLRNTSDRLLHSGPEDDFSVCRALGRSSPTLRSSFRLSYTHEGFLSSRPNIRKDRFVYILTVHHTRPAPPDAYFPLTPGGTGVWGCDPKTHV